MDFFELWLSFFYKLCIVVEHSKWVHIVVKMFFYTLIYFSCISVEMIKKKVEKNPFVIFHHACNRKRENEWFTIWVMGNDAALQFFIFFSIKSYMCAWRHNSRWMNECCFAYICLHNLHIHSTSTHTLTHACQRSLSNS